MTRALAIILARGGSKGVPGKNTRMIAGRPCIEWTLDHARGADRVGLIAVSSDDSRTLAIAREAGVIALPRPAHLASDTARIDDAARDAVLLIEAMFAGDPVSRSPPPIVILYANVPVRPEGLIDAALDTLAQTRCDSVQSYAGVGKYHPWWTARLEGDARVRPWEGDVLNHGIFRRQDLPPAYVPDGGVIALTRRALFLEVPGVEPGPHAFFGADRRGVITREGEVIDIDSERDVHVAEAVLSRRPGYALTDFRRTP